MKPSPNTGTPISSNDHLLSFSFHSRHAIEAVDRMLQDVRSTTKPFGGITVVFGGDFQQTLPVVVKGTREDVVHATLQSSPLWNKVHVLHLHQNMRLHSHPQHTTFAHWLLDVGHGRLTDHKQRPSSMTVPTAMCSQSENDLIETIYGSMRDNNTIPPQFFHERAILAPRNIDIRNLNDTILNLFPGDEREYCSADTYTMETPTEHINNDIPVEFLHSLNASGLPVAHLRLKEGCPIMILRNIDSKKGLCNGTRATITRMSSRLLEIKLITGDHAGETALIPRITLSPSLTGLDFAIKLNRRQFPIQLAFAMTINKAQGQTVNKVGIDLRKPSFAHGQLYVAFSRATSPEHVKVLLPDDCQAKSTRNVVYNEILLD